MDNYQYAELKDAIKRISELEEQIDMLKNILLNSVNHEGHIKFSSEAQSFLYCRIGEEE